MSSCWVEGKTKDQIVQNSNWNKAKYPWNSVVWLFLLYIIYFQTSLTFSKTELEKIYGGLAYTNI